jgi:site-specific recombinase XerD
LAEQVRTPLAELAEQLFIKLSELRYTEDYIYYLRLLCEKLLKYANGVGEEYMTEELKEAFIHDLYGSRKKAARDYAARCAEMLLMMQDYGTILYKRPVDGTFPGVLGRLYEDFAATYSGIIKDSTMATYRTYLRVSADYLAEHEVSDVNDITPDTIVTFTMTLSKFSAHSSTSIMRLFVKLLRYAFEHGFSTEDKSRYCIKVQFYGGEKIPPTFSIEEIAQLLSAIDRSTASGKRDYAMIMLSTRTGLRSCDIIGLKMNHLRFDTDTIEITQQKTGKMLSLPLTEETGSALIEYLREGRPDSEYDNVFIRHRAPYKPFNSNGNRMIGRHMKRAGIEDYENRQPGFRAFRHSLAGNLLDNDVSIYKIQGILGHDSPNTTMRYVKIDTKGLKTCALEVPLRQP